MRFTYYGGFDWAHDHHDVVIVDRRGQMIDDFAIQHTAEGWQRWREQVAVLGTEKNSGMCGDQPRHGRRAVTGKWNYGLSLHASNQLKHGSWVLTLQSS